MAGTPQACEAMNLEWFKTQGLVYFTERHAALQH